MLSIETTVVPAGKLALVIVMPGISPEVEVMVTTLVVALIVPPAKVGLPLVAL